MAEYIELLKEEFNESKSEIEQFTKELEKQLVIASTEDKTSMTLLKTLMINTKVSIEQIESYRPTPSKKSEVPYAEAIKTVFAAKRLVARAEAHLESDQSKPQPTPQTDPSSSIRRTIPEVKIPFFDGNVTEYKSFISAFQLKFDPLPIQKKEKLQQLKEYLCGTPLSAIKPLPLTDENYDRALETLANLYDKPSDAVNALWAQLESMPESLSDDASLTATYFQVEGILSALESQGYSLDVFPPLKKQVHEVYPRWLRLQACKSVSQTVGEFQKEVAKIISIRTSVNMNSTPHKSSRETILHANHNQTPRGDHRNDYRSEQNEDKNGDQNGGRVIPPCAFCEQKHYTNNCPKKLTLAERRNLTKNRCGICLRLNHKTSECRRKYVCYYCKASDHHQALCPRQYGAPDVTPPPPKKEDNSSAETKSKLVGFVRSHQGAHTTAMITVVNPITDTSYSVRALFDNGSSETYISESAARRFGLDLSRFRTAPVTVFGIKQPIKVRTATTAFRVSNNDNFVVDVIGETIPNVPQDVKLFDYTEFIKINPEYQNIPFLDQGKSRPIEILLGGDYYFDILSPESKKKIHEGLYIYATEFGHMLVGRKPQEEAGSALATYSVMSPAKAIDSLTSLEMLGIREEPKSILEEEEIALKQFYENLSFDPVEKRYEIRWPWREYPPPLQNNFGLALGVLKSQQKKLNEKTFAAYNEIIQKQIDSKIIEELPVKDPLSAGKYYLPHHAVITPEKSTPIRIVFNGRAKSATAKYAINEVIYKGINLLVVGVGVLIRSILVPIFSTADLEKAFHQLKIHKIDRNYVWFLWIIDWSKPPTGANLRFLRFLRVAFGIDASPFLLYATLRYHLEKCRTPRNSHIIDAILRNMYADNVNGGFENEIDATEFYELAVEIFNLCSMNLRAWASNCAALREKFTQPNTSDSISILGIRWNQFNDTYKYASINPTEKPTLRSALSTTSSFYDPCGWATPLVTSAKLFLRTLHDAGYDWDDELSVQHKTEWNELQKEITKATQQSFPRFRFNMLNKSAVFELHVFSDASEKAYACTLYLRNVNENDTATALVLAKSRITPKTPQYSIPKLELIAAVLASKMITFTRTELPLKYHKTILWIDSKCVLNWLTRKRLLPVYVQRRVDSIKNIPDLEFRYVPSEMNPADLPSRGGTADDLPLFRTGPEWLKNESDWPPEWQVPTQENDAAEKEILDTFPAPTVAAVTQSVPHYPFNLDRSRFSSYTSLLRATMYIMKFITHVFKDKSPFPSPSLFAAEKLWLKQEQQNHYYHVITAINERKKHELVQTLNLYLDPNELLRCAGRFQFAPLSPDEKRPILLPPPKSSRFTALLVEHYHRKYFHAGTSATLHAIRKKFWLPAGRRAVYTIVRACTGCKRFTARPYKQPEKSDLPDIRLYEESPFNNIGVDTFGPLYVKGVKYFALLVVDLVIRAVDLELLINMTAEEIYLALRRVIARRTLPLVILSDNAPQFKYIQREFSLQFTHEWSWKYIPEHSPWMGGAYERFVGLVKSALRRTFYSSSLSESGLRTAFSEIAATLNDRPLTYVSAEREDDPLTPNLFLNTHYDVSKLPEPITEPEKIRSFISQAAETNAKFWKVWKGPYLQHLRTQYLRHNFPKKVTQFVPRVGDIVIIAESLLKRERWRLGKITKLHGSKDNEIRSAAVQTQHGIINRPVSQLYPLELHTDVEPPADLDPIDDWDDPEISVQVIDDEEIA